MAEAAGLGQSMHDRELRAKVKWLMIFRVTVVTVLLGSLSVLHVYQEREPARAIFSLIIATYALSLFYALIYNHVANLKFFAYIQVLGDILLETGVVYATGSIDSAFSFTYIFSIIAAGIILLRRGSFLFASLAGIAYGTLVDLQYYGLILPSPNRLYTESELFYNIFLTFIAYYTIAFLSSSLSERLKVAREELQEKSTGLRELQALNENIVRSMADGMLIIGLDGRIESFSKAAEGITGFTEQEVQGKSFAEVFKWLGVETFFHDREAAGRLPYRYELAFRRDGRDLALGMMLSPLRDESGRITGLLGIFQDLTPMKEMEIEIKRKDRLAAIGEVAAGVAHEIRNPLASLSGALQVLKADLKLVDDDERLMGIALSEMDRLNGIVTDFLNYARPQSPSREFCDASTVFSDTVELLTNGRDLPEGLEISLDLPEEALVIWADAAQMRQVLLNLLINAVQSGATGIVARAWKEGPKTFMEVEDNGEGINPEDIDRIFFPFFSKKEGGSGLGLSIVYRIVEEHGGTITAASEPGRCTRMTVTVPSGELR
ncbi:MAG TPA: ATP-binding protein [Nitrospirota bacterium]|jgi:two-component system sensor histidine kinase PilS (NtrC family)